MARLVSVNQTPAPLGLGQRLGPGRRRKSHNRYAPLGGGGSAKMANKTLGAPQWTEKTATRRPRAYIWASTSGTKIKRRWLPSRAQSCRGTAAPRPRRRTDSVLAAVVAAAEGMMRSGFGPATDGRNRHSRRRRPQRGLVVVTPNEPVGRPDRAFWRTVSGSVALSNDCNPGALGESWLGAAALSSITILVGTGVGSGLSARQTLGRRPGSRPARSGISSARSAGRSAAAAISDASKPWPADRPLSATSARPWPRGAPPR